MKLAVNTRYLLPQKMEGFGVYSHEILSRIVGAHHEDTFQFYFDRTFDRKYVYGPNVVPKVIGPPARHPLLYHYWYQVRLKGQLERSGADVFFSPDSYMPRRLRMPAVITVHDVAPMRYPEHLTRAHRSYYLKNVPRFIAQADHLITVSEFSKKEIVAFFGVDESRVSVVHNAVAPRFKQVPDDQQARFRQQLAGGRPYFLYVGAIHPRKNVAELIRAFALFKKRVSTDVQLVIAGQRSWKAQEVSKAIAESGCANDIYELGYVPATSLPGLIGSALAMCYVSLYEGFGIPVLEAMACGVPVITSASH